MNIEELNEYCMLKENVTAEFPFDLSTVVYKVNGKMFCLSNVDQPVSCNLKCDPERSEELRTEYEQITPGFHMNKKHWNTILFEGRLSNALFKELIDHSYNLVNQKASKRKTKDNELN